MEHKNIDFTLKRTEQVLSSVGAKVADANELAEEIAELTALQDEKLVEAQEELDDLYGALGEVEEKVDAGEGQAQAQPYKSAN